jgi:hypothetical protein
MRGICGFCLVLALAACSGAGSWSKAGASPEKAAQDYAECRHSAEIAHRRDSDIDTDILAARGEDWHRADVLTMKRDNYADSNRARSGDIVERCMNAKGYTTPR